MKFLKFCLILLIIATKSNAENVSVAVSIKPLYGLVAKITKGVLDPVLLYDGSTSPHVQTLSPSQVINLKNSSLIFMIGESYESALVKTLKKLDLKNVVFLENTPNLMKLSYRFGHHHDDAHNHDEHDGDEDIDGHMWLDLGNALILLQKIHDTLVETDVEHKKTYDENLERAKKEIQTSFNDQKKRLDTLSFKKYVMYHDAFQYFDIFFKTQCVGVITPDANHHMMGLKHLHGLKQLIKKENVRVLISEPQFSKTPDLGLIKVSVDYLGKDLSLSEYLFEEILERVVTQMVSIFSNKGSD